MLRLHMLKVNINFLSNFISNFTKNKIEVLILLNQRLLKGDSLFLFPIILFWVKMKLRSIQLISVSICPFLTLTCRIFRVVFAFFKKVEVEPWATSFFYFQITWLKNNFYKNSGQRKKDKNQHINQIN